MYTIRNCSFDDISCGNSGAYINPNNVKTDFFVKIIDSEVTLKKIYVVNGEFFYKEQKSRTYVDNDAFHQNKFVLQNKGIT